MRGAGVSEGDDCCSSSSSSNNSNNINKNEVIAFFLGTPNFFMCMVGFRIDV